MNRTDSHNGRPRPTAAAGLLLLAFAALMAGGCARSPRSGVPPGFQSVELSERLRPLQRKLNAEGERNWVLNLNAIAMGALRDGDRETAKRALDESVMLIEVIYGDSEQARRARSIWFREESKVFKGDPYERSMTYMYRGILYLQDRDWDNARACFRSVLFHDSLAADQQNRGDWVLPHYLIGVCEVQMKRPTFAREAFVRAEAAYSEFVAAYSPLEDSHRAPRLELRDSLPPFDEETNLLVVTQHGRAPRKKATGSHGELLAYIPGGGAGMSPATVAVDGNGGTRTSFGDSVYFQAATRGGRGVDGILGQQAKLRGGAEAAGSVAVLGGAVVAAHGVSSGSDSTALAGAGVLAAGALMYGFSTMVQPQADTREWAALPDSLGIAVSTAKPGVREIEVSYSAEDANRFGGNTRARELVEVPEPGAGVAVILAFPPPAVSLVGGIEHDPTMEVSS